MNDSNVHKHIEELVAEEEALFAKTSGGDKLSDADRKRLEAVQVELDRYYDLLRQRRAREEFGQNPDTAKLRSDKTVEGYLQ